MKKLLLLLCAIGITVVKAQDLIITTTYDSISCLIEKQDEAHVYFRIANGQPNLIPLSKVLKTETGYFLSAEEKKTFKRKKHGVRLQLGVGGGYSYMTGKAPSDAPQVLKDHIRELKTAAHFKTNAVLLLGKHSGIGFNYSLFRTENRFNNIIVTPLDGSSSRIGSLQDDITINGFGLSYNQHYDIAEKSSFYSLIGLSYFDYKNNFILIDPSDITANTVGLTVGLGIDYLVSPRMAIAFEISLNSVPISEYTSTEASGKSHTLKLDEPDNNSRFDFTIALRFR